MRIQVATEGGLAHLPQLNKPFAVDSEQLSKQEADELQRLVNAADFFNLPPAVDTPPPGAADYRRYTITIQDQGKQHTVHTTDLTTNSDLQALLAYTRTHRPGMR